MQHAEHSFLPNDSETGWPYSVLSSKQMASLIADSVHHHRRLLCQPTSQSLSQVSIAGRAGAEAASREGEEEDETLRGFAFTALESHEEGILERLQPLCVVMYDPDIAFVRQLEVQGPKICLSF